MCISQPDAGGEVSALQHQVLCPTTSFSRPRGTEVNTRNGTEPQASPAEQKNLSTHWNCHKKLRREGTKVAKDTTTALSLSPKRQGNGCVTNIRNWEKPVSRKINEQKTLHPVTNNYPYPTFRPRKSQHYRSKEITALQVPVLPVLYRNVFLQTTRPSDCLLKTCHCMYPILNTSKSSPSVFQH